MNYFEFNAQEIITSEQKSDISKITSNFEINCALRNEIYSLLHGRYYQGIATKTITDSNMSVQDKMTLNAIFTQIKNSQK